ncbi:MAG: pilus assembly protein PilM [Phycisphaerae bacterium]
MSTTNKPQILPIGVDLGSHTLKVAQLCHTEGTTELLASGCAELSGSVEFGSAHWAAKIGSQLKKILKSGPFKGKAAIVSLPAEATFVQHVKIPKVPAAQQLAAIEQEVATKLPYSIDDAVLQHIVAGEAFGEGDPRQEVIVVCSARKTVELCAKMLTRAGLDTQAINIEPCAIVECFARLFRRASDASRTIMFIDMGELTTQVVFSQGSRIVFARNLKQGGRSLMATASKRLNLEPDQLQSMRFEILAGRETQISPDQLYEAMNEPVDLFAKELLQCVHYYESVFRNQSIERAIFVGGQAYDRRLCQMIARKLNLPAQIGDPLVRVARREGSNLTTTDPLPNWAVAVGLSLGGERAA